MRGVLTLFWKLSGAEIKKQRDNYSKRVCTQASNLGVGTHSKVTAALNHKSKKMTN